mmetsp:Transcript_16556/g.38924  ORF Transcript_16556/g.38924 Transcript_16556/m.38924 type:complete len:277 (+) Transcript_16556:326-1156(+)
MHCLYVPPWAVTATIRTAAEAGTLLAASASLMSRVASYPFINGISRSISISDTSIPAAPLVASDVTAYATASLGSRKVITRTSSRSSSLDATLRLMLISSTTSTRGKGLVAGRSTCMAGDGTCAAPLCLSRPRTRSWGRSSSQASDEPQASSLRWHAAAIDTAAAAAAAFRLRRCAGEAGGIACFCLPLTLGDGGTCARCGEGGTCRCGDGGMVSCRPSEGGECVRCAGGVFCLDGGGVGCLECGEAGTLRRIRRGQESPSLPRLSTPSSMQPMEA